MCVSCIPGDLIPEKYISILKNCEGENVFPVDEILQGKFDHLFQQTSLVSPAKKECQFFVKIEQEYIRKGLENHKKYLRYDYALMQHLRLYYSDGSVSKWTGKHENFNSREYADRNFIYSISNNKMPLLFEMKTNGIVRLTFEQITEKTLRKISRFEHIQFGGVLGTMGFLLILSLSAAVLVRYFGFVVYALYLASLTLTQLSLLGFSYQYFWKSSIEFNKLSTIIFPGIVFLSLSLFLMIHVANRKTSLVLLRVAAAFSIINIFLAVFFYGQIAISFNSLSALISSICILIALVWNLLSLKDTELYLYVLGTVLFLGSAIVYSLRDRGIIPHSYYIDNATSAGILSEAIIFSLGIAFWVYKLQKSNFDIQKNLLKANATNNELKAIARTTQVLAHDVRRPLNMIDSLLKVLGQAKSIEEVNQIKEKSVHKIQYAKSSVDNMIHSLLEMGREKEFVFENVKLKPYVEEVVEKFALFREEHLNAVVVGEIPDISVSLDKESMGRVLFNILENAVEICKEKSGIKVQALEKGKQVHLLIENKGSYIEPTKREKVFEVFYTSDKKDGTGLGLAIAKKIVEAHGGSISCDSSLDKNTTTFSITLKKIQ